jgi:hypothetical protein
MLDYFYTLSVKELATLVCVLFVGFTWVGALFIRPFLQTMLRSNQRINNVIGSFVSMFGIFYGILMGLLAVASYQNKVDVEQSITSEGASLFVLIRNVSAYPESVRIPVQKSIRDYIQFVIDTEWPQMRKGELARGGMQHINDMQKQITNFEPQTAGQEILHAETSKQLSLFLERRALRLYSAISGIPDIMWFVVLFGAFLSIFLVWMFRMPLISNMFLGGLLSFFIGAMISLIVVLDRPLRGESGIPPEVYHLLLKFMNTMMGHPTG